MKKIQTLTHDQQVTIANLRANDVKPMIAEALAKREKLIAECDKLMGTPNGVRARLLDMDADGSGIYTFGRATNLLAEIVSDIKYLEGEIKTAMKELSEDHNLIPSVRKIAHAGCLIDLANKFGFTLPESLVNIGDIK